MNIIEYNELSLSTAAPKRIKAGSALPRTGGGTAHILTARRRPSNLLFRILCLGSLLFALPSLAQAAETGAPTPEGWLPHFESLITLGIVIMAFAIATLLNHQLPKLRAVGTLLAAGACFGIVVWFSSVLSLGVLENPKPHQAPMDGFKPTLLWTQAGVALLGGAMLVVIAIRQFSRGDELILPNTNDAERYGRVSRILHWTTAFLFIFMIPTGIFASIIPEGAWYRTEYNVVHKTIGIILLILVLVRLAWNRVSKRPSLDATLKPAERKLAHSAHILLYGLMIAMPITGYVMTSLHGYPSFFFTLELPSVLPESQAYIVWGLFHKYVLQYLIYLILGAHVLGALKHHFIDKHEKAIKRMVS